MKNEKSVKLNAAIKEKILVKVLHPEGVEKLVLVGIPSSAFNFCYLICHFRLIIGIIGF